MPIRPWKGHHVSRIAGGLRVSGINHSFGGMRQEETDRARDLWSVADSPVPGCISTRSFMELCSEAFIVPTAGLKHKPQTGTNPSSRPWKTPWENHHPEPVASLTIRGNPIRVAIPSHPRGGRAREREFPRPA
jgi:hypothetical protein